MYNSAEELEATASAEPELICVICGSNEKIALVPVGGIMYIGICHHCRPNLGNYYITHCISCGFFKFEEKNRAAKRIKDPEIKKSILSTRHLYISFMQSCIICDREGFIFDEFEDYQERPIQQT